MWLILNSALFGLNQWFLNFVILRTPLIIVHFAEPMTRNNRFPTTRIRLFIVYNLHFTRLWSAFRLPVMNDRSGSHNLTVTVVFYKMKSNKIQSDHTFKAPPPGFCEPRFNNHRFNDHTCLKSVIGLVPGIIGQMCWVSRIFIDKAIITSVSCVAALGQLVANNVQHYGFLYCVTFRAKSTTC